jgi:hypothetical protein
VSATGSVTADYKLQYHIVLVTNPPGIASPTGASWHDNGTYITVSTPAFVDIVPGSSRYRFNGWTTADMSEIANPSASPTTVFIDKPKTVTANYVVQYYVTFAQTGVSSDFTGTIVTIDGHDYAGTDLPISFWWDTSSMHSFAFQSPLVVTDNVKQYVWTSTTGLSTLQSDSIEITSSGTVTGNYGTQYFLTIQAGTGGTTTPTPGVYPYNAGSTASVAANPNVNFALDYWLLDSVNVGSTSPYPVLMDGSHTIKAIFKSALPPPAPMVSINPLSGAIVIGQSITFSSSVSGGTPSYTYQWYLNGNPVAGATSSSWTFTPTGTGFYQVYVVITDSNHLTAQSDPANILVNTPGAIPVGGYSISFTHSNSMSHMTAYTAIVTLLGIGFSLIRRRRK